MPETLEFQEVALGIIMLLNPARKDLGPGGSQVNLIVMGTSEDKCTLMRILCNSSSFPTALSRTLMEEWWW